MRVNPSNKLIFTLFLSLLLSGVYGQEKGASSIVNSLFELKVTSIEREITFNKKGTITHYYVNYTVKNISNDTLVYTTNSCFYYNHYQLTLGDNHFGLNSGGGCSGNMINPHTLYPGRTFKGSDMLMFPKMDSLKPSIVNASLEVPLRKENESRYTVDGRDHVDNTYILYFSGQIEFNETIIDKRKKKKEKKHKK